ncbi:hypothetical protein [Volucribacter amazonae]|uniref:hypothetical protein n=1 Tax=Volucribacter amazonae TaxID=256731 RepID=UPI002442D17D|nr:hypothetical protein [Volucribacter amazonae]
MAISIEEVMKNVVAVPQRQMTEAEWYLEKIESGELKTVSNEEVMAKLDALYLKYFEK